MRFSSLASGSAGNCMVVSQGTTHVLLDCGLGARDVTQRLAARDLTPAQITGILITHEHDDHAKGAFKFAASHGIAVWLTHGTYSMCTRYLPEKSAPPIRIIDSHQSFQIQDLEITPYTVPHDAREPTQFTFSNGVSKLGVLTDAGSVTPHMIASLNGCDALVLECNHDLEMLRNGPYSGALKKRVGGRLGHLDNAAAADLLSRLDHHKLKHIIAAHLSAKNNTPQLAKRALAETLGCDLDWVGVADQILGFDWREV